MKRPRIARSVSFSAYSEEVPTLTLDDYTDQEFDATWYGDDEFDARTKRCLKLIKKLNDNKHQKSCIRGLEGMTLDAIESRHKLRARSFRAVLKEQSKGADAEAIAAKYREVAPKACQKEARKVGKQDARIVEKLRLQ